MSAPRVRADYAGIRNLRSKAHKDVWEKPSAAASPRLAAHHQRELEALAVPLLPYLRDAPFLDSKLVQSRQCERITELLSLASNTALYAQKMADGRVRPQDFSALPDLARFPVTTKQELIAAYPEGCVLPLYHRRKAYCTWSSGSTGLTLPIKFDPSAVLLDTLQGIRQLMLQSDFRIEPDDIVTHYYTCPWWTNHISGRWRSGFIASLTPADEAIKVLRRTRPAVLAGYPSLLIELMRHCEPGELHFKVVITNSEQSTRTERDCLSKHFGCPVLDEYSSEELTRIALELPDKHYYVHEDSVYLEIIDPQTGLPTQEGAWGEAVVTGLLNTAMPLLRYATGDLVRKSANKTRPWHDIGWTRLGAIGGRKFDSFIRPDGRLVPSGTVLDIIYRAIGDCGVCIEAFELTQHDSRDVQLALKPSRRVRPEVMRHFSGRVKELLDFVMETPIRLEVKDYPSDRAVQKRKRRPIRRTYRPKYPSHEGRPA